MGRADLITRRKDLRAALRSCVSQSIGFVPTMGALHEGHGELLKKAKSENETVVLSVFVNPKQFGPREDLSKYPRTLQDDVLLAKSLGVDFVYSPIVDEMYPLPFLTRVLIDDQMGKVLCGQYRDNHFEGVCTVVLLLLNLVMPTRAYFGLKDFQQFSILRKMCADLGHPSEIIGVPTVRSPRGLALSSRNRFLSEAEAAQALALPQSLLEAWKLHQSGERDPAIILSAAQNILLQKELVPQYLELRDAGTLAPLSESLTENQDAVLAVAAFLGSTRLIDNIVLSHSEPYLSAGRNLNSLLTSA